MASIIWDSGKSNANISLDGTSLVASQNSASNTWCSIQGVTGVLLGGTGKVYFEMQVTAKDTNAGWLGGVGDTSAGLADGDYAGKDNHAIGYQPSGSTVYINGGFSGNHGLNPGNVGDWWGWAIDATIPGIWAVNVTNDPTHCAGGTSSSQAFSDIAAGLRSGSLGGMTGTVYPMFSGQDDTTICSCTLDTTGSHGTIPSGFTALALNPPTLIPSIDTRRNRTYLRR